MQVAKTIKEVRTQVKQWRREDQSVGLVTTMGYLHEGHGSLITRAHEENDKVIVTIFLNPTQFAANEDLSKYPTDIEGDLKMCEELGADLVFQPSVEEMYAPDRTTNVTMDVLTDTLCGKGRPEHFGGVCTVVSKLFNICAADKAYFGEKDAQQLAIIKRMVRDLNFDIEIIGCPTIREADGLAKSSRNSYLNEEERKAAVIVSKAVFAGRDMVEAGERDPEVVKARMREIIESEPLARIDYVDAVDGATMQPLTELKGDILVAVAVFIGKARLIDNFMATV